jgi:hypothetical protein
MDVRAPIVPQTLPMISTAANRRLGWWLVGLFLCAQVLGVMPLMSEHTAGAELHPFSAGHEQSFGLSVGLLIAVP